MTFKEKIKKLREVNASDKLVVFVGAGVSKNSGIPTWRELLRHFASEFFYGECKKCSHRKIDCYTDEGCKENYDFSQDEYLKIPQYFYNIDKSKQKSRYREIIKETLNIEAEPNLINNLIMKLYPKHIITTNFDKLIEKTQNPNSMMYKVITKDKELLTQISNNYIIKMHGDIDDLKEIVLKENDYLTYQQDHILIETFIKTLLLDHTFLFVGYKLNDNNLKLLLSWIIDIAKKRKVGKNQRPRNFIISETNTADEYIERYFLENNLFVINPFDLPEKLKEKNSAISLDSLGKNVYTVLDYILDNSNDYHAETLVDVLYDRFQIFKNQKRISFESLKSEYFFRDVEYIDQLFLFKDKSKFELLKKVLTANNKKASFINEILTKAGVKGIGVKYENQIQLLHDVGREQNVYYELIELEQSNNYVEILSMTNELKDEIVKAYYLYVSNPYSEDFKSSLVEVEKSLTNSKDYFKLLHFKYNMISIKKSKEDKLDFERMLNNIPKAHKITCLYLEKIYEGNCDNIYTCNQLADKCEKKYTKKTDNIELGTIQNHDLLKLQAIAYDYYYYFKINNLMLDHFTNPKIFLEPYARSMLCTYSPKKERKIDWFGHDPILKEYKLNSIDFDIIIKHTNLKKIKLFFSDFNVKELIFEEGIKVEEKFVNLCNSIKLFPNRFLNAYLNSFLYILTKCQLDKVKLNIIINSIYELLFKNSELREKILPDISNELMYFFEYFNNENLASFTKILNGFLNCDIINYSEKHHLRLERIYRILRTYSNKDIQKKVSGLIDNIKKVNEKIKMIYYLHELFNDYDKYLYMIIVKNNLGFVGSRSLYDYIVKEYLEYDEKIEERFFDILKGEVDKRKQKSGVRYSPDWLMDTINDLIILFLLNRIKTLKKFECFAEYSKQLTFLLKPENFDYSKIKTEDYMWMNLLQDNRYIEIFQKHSTEFIKDLKKSVRNGYATEAQKMIFYKYFLPDEEIFDYL